MSYCRFHNTLIDLRECYEALSNEGLESLSESERKSAIKLIEICKDISDEHSEYDDDEGEDV